MGAAGRDTSDMEMGGRLDQLLFDFSSLLPRETIDEVVAETLAEFRDARVKAYVPILVERFVEQRLRALQTASAGEGPANRTRSQAG